MTAAEDAERWERWGHELSKADRVMAKLRERYGPPTPRRSSGSAYASLARSIVYQQLHGAAARTIWGRLETVVGRPFTAARLVAVDDDTLRAAGLSRAKLTSLRDLSERVASGELKLTGLSRHDDEEVIRRLVVVKGIGRWTAEMFLLFHLRRPDVWPCGDLGVKKGFMRAYGWSDMPTAEELSVEGERFRPYRSVAAWYLWRVAEEREAR